MGADSFCGSHAYLAPEMIMKNGHGKAIDYYSLGILLYEMVLGKPPFYDEDKERMLKKVVKEKLEIPKGVAPMLESLLRGLLEKDIEKRLGFREGFQEIKRHPWLEGVDWNGVLQRKLKQRSPDEATFKLFSDQSELENALNPNRLQNWTFLK